MLYFFFSLSFVSFLHFVVINLLDMYDLELFESINIIQFTVYNRAETCGSSCYRLTSKTGEPIYLRTHGYLEVDKDSQIVVSLVCINTLVS